MTNKIFKSFFAIATVLGVALGFASCEKEGEKVAADPTVEVSASTLNFTNAEGEQTVNVTSNANWKVEVVPADSWVTVTPMSGNGDKSITVAVAENTDGVIREATVKVIALHATYGPWETKSIKVSQSATEAPTVTEELLYGDNFDGKEATKTFGSGSSWPYIDQFPEFANAEGPASENVNYTGSGVSVRANSASNSSYSDYAGSGSNNIFFGANAYFQINNIALNAAQKDYKLTFGSEKYTQDGDSTFQTSEFHVYLSKDGVAWAELEYTFAGTEPGRWNVATANFSLTAVPENLYIKFAADVASVYRLDDVQLYVGNGGQTVDLDDVQAPEVKKVTVAEFLVAAEDATIYELTGEITSVTNETYGNFYLKDSTGEVLIYGLCSPTGESKYWATSGAKVGDTITVQTVRTSYNGTPQGKNAIFVSLVPGEGGTEEPEPTPMPEAGSYTLIDSVDGLAAGTYFMAGYMESYSYTQDGETISYDWSEYPYHVCTGVSTDLYTDNYSFADGKLTKDPQITTAYDKSEIELIAVDGKANTYYVKFVKDGQYLCSTASATNRKLGLTDTATEWVATANANGGITLSSNSVYLGTAAAASKLLRSYKNESTLKYGVVFFKAN